MKDFNKILKANKDFLEKTKSVYMVSFRNKFPGAQKSRYSYRPFALGFAGVISLMLVVSSSAVYADQTNAGIDSLLYPMKRAYESVSLTVASTDEKPLLQLEFAGRRLKEIESIAQNNPDPSKETKLLEDLNNSISDSMAALGDGIETGAVATIQQTFQKSVQQDNARNTAQSVPENVPQTVTMFAPSAGLSASSTPTGAAGGFSATSIEDSKGAESPVVEVKKPDEEKNLAGSLDIESGEKNVKNTAVCESFNNLFNNGSPYIDEILRKNPEYLEKFENNCK
ncbi:MAG: DUF5667 domain-containing protein [Candidatus Paceibacterota bacterium]